MSQMLLRKTSTNVDRWPQDYPFQSGPRSVSTFVPTSNSKKQNKIKRSRFGLVEYLRLPKFSLECLQNILLGMPGPGVRTDQMLPGWQEKQEWKLCTSGDVGSPSNIWRATQTMPNHVNCDNPKDRPPSESIVWLDRDDDLHIITNSCLWSSSNRR